jgi:energy-coupling factor transporter ATP-binding protein EcfA2
MARPKSNKAKELAIDFFEKVYKDLRDEVIVKLKEKSHKALLKAQHRLIGQTIAVIGPPAAGKSTLLKVLKDLHADSSELSSYDKTEVQAVGTFPVDFLLSCSDQQFRFKFKVRKFTDVGGEEYIRNEAWKQVINGAASIIYIADGQCFFDGNSDYRKRVLADFEWILQNAQRMQPGFKVVLAVNKIDTLCDARSYGDFATKSRGSIDAFQQEILNIWPPHLAQNLAPAIFLSLLDPTLRAHTLNELMLSFVGESLRKLVEKEGTPGND